MTRKYSKWDNPDSCQIAHNGEQISEEAEFVDMQLHFFSDANICLTVES
jgi:hypothetical protein